MLTLIHAPNSRSTRVLHLIKEMGIEDRIQIKTVGIVYRDGSGAMDPANPHPEGKVPALIHDGALITESGAIMLYLTEMFPDSNLSPRPGSASRGTFLTWLFWYQGVMEPVMMAAAMGISHPGFQRNFRGVEEVNARIRAALAKGPWLCGDSYTVADLICGSAYTFLPQFLPEDAAFCDWSERCATRPALAAAKARDAELMAMA